MKRILLLLVIACVGIPSFAKTKIPPRLLRDVKVYKDEFNGNTIYSNKTPLYIVQGDSLTLYFSLSCTSPVPVKYNKLQILSNGNVYTSNDSIRETPTLEKYAVSTFSGKGSALSFNTRNAYNYEWKSANNITLIDNILKYNKFKVKFDGEQSQILNYEYYFVDKMRTMFALYKYLKENK